MIGVVHLRATPGSPDWGGSMREVEDAAAADALGYEEGGCDAVFLENFGDLPFTGGAVGCETVAAMAAVASRVRREVGLPIGFNVLRNDAAAALGLCAACGGEFIRVNVHSGAMMTDQGLIEGEAHETVRRRGMLCPEVKILADILVKHALPLTALPIEQVAVDTLQRGRADALIVSGTATGAPVDVEDLRRVRAACPEAALLVGSGVNEGNVRELLEFATGLIVATSVKRDGELSNPVDAARVRRLVDRAKG